MAKLGRKFIPIDKHQLEKLMGFRPSLYDVAGFFKVSRDKIQHFIRDEYDMEFKEFRSTYMSGTKLSIIQKAVKKAHNGDNEMIKFCLNNLAGWTNGYASRPDFDEEDFIDEIQWVDE